MDNNDRAKAEAIANALVAADVESPQRLGLIVIAAGIRTLQDARNAVTATKHANPLAHNILSNTLKEFGEDVS